MNDINRVLDINFTMLKYCGFWKPASMKNKFAKFIYHLYTALVMFIIISLTLQKFVVIPTTTNELDDFIGHLFPFVEILCSIAKGFNFLLMHRKIELAIESMINNDLYNRPINQLEVDWKTSTDRKSRFVTEIKLQNFYKYKLYNFHRYITVLFITLGIFNVAYLLTAPLSKGPSQAILPMINWNTYNEYSSTKIFFLTYVHHSLLVIYSASITISNDTLVPGVMMHLCAQLKIFKHRINNFSKLKMNKLTDLRCCVKQHNQIYKYVLKNKYKGYSMQKCNSYLFSELAKLSKKLFKEFSLFNLSPAL